MRLVFSLVGILVAVVIVLLLAKNQLSATRGVVERTSTVTAPASDKNAPAPTNVQQASQQAQRNVANQIDEALKQGAAARTEAVDK